MDTILEKAHQRVQAICEKIRTETLDPAKAEALEIIEHAKKDAEKIKAHARHEAEKHLHDLKKKLEEERRIFTSSLHQAAEQSIETLKQKIENALFNPSLDKWLSAQISTSENGSKLVEAIVRALDRDGIKANLQLKIAHTMSAEEILAKVATEIADRLKKGSVAVADFQGGVQVHLEGKHVTIDLSEKVLKELVTTFIRKDFRKFFFANS